MNLQDLEKTIRTAADYSFSRRPIDDAEVSAVVLKEIFRRCSDILVFGDLEEDFQVQLKNPELGFSNELHTFMKAGWRSLKIAIPDPEKFKTSSLYNVLQPHHGDPSYRLDFRIADEKLIKKMAEEPYKEMIYAVDMKTRSIFSRTKTAFTTDPAKTFQTHVDFNAPLGEYYSFKKLFQKSSYHVDEVNFWELEEAIPEFPIEFSKNLS